MKHEAFLFHVICYMFHEKSFTLIELLVVIAILGTLAALLVPNFMGARERARDTQRKSDIKQIQKALEMYKLDQTGNNYIDTIDFSELTCNTAWSTYMSKFPCDSLSGTQGYEYRYELDATDSRKYTLCACLENMADSEGEACPFACNDCTLIGKGCYTVSEP